MTSVCEERQATLSAWLDGEDEAADRCELLDHLVRCADCRQFYRQARALDGLAAGLRPAGADPAPPEALWTQIQAAAAEPPAGGRSSAIPGWAWRAAAVLVLATGLALAVWKPAPRPVTESGAEIEIVLEENAEAMTEERFLEIATEVLRSDRRFHREMYQVMHQVMAATGATEAEIEEERRGELESEPESGGERLEGDRGLA